MRDDEILALFRQRNEDAILECSRRYGFSCFTVAYHILKSREDTEECVNETWLRAWDAIPPGCPRNLKVYLLTIARNLAFSRYRKETALRRGGSELPEVLDELAECVAAPGSPEEAVMASELREGINRFLKHLPKRDRDVFLRRYFFVESPVEIGERYGITSGNVSVILNRVRKKLKQFLIQEELIYDK